MSISTISTKGQITLPVEMRRRLKIKPKDRVVLELDGDSIRIKKAGDFLALEGFLGPGKTEEVEREKMRDAVAKHVLGHES